MLRPLDFSAAGIALDEGEVSKIPPLLALASGRLARGLLRVQCRDDACTLDAIATPLLDGTRDRPALAGAVKQMAVDIDPSRAQDFVNFALEKFARLGLLMPDTRAGETSSG